MTNYVSLLNDDDLLALCKIINAKNFWKIFRNNSKEFNRIKRSDPNILGKASDDDTFLFVVKNRNEDFICRSINEGVHQWLKEVQDNTDKLLSEGRSEAEALTETLSKSVFSEHIGLYFTLSGNSYSEEYVSMIHYAIELKAKLARAEEQARVAGEKAEQIETDSNERLIEADKQISTLKGAVDELQAYKAVAELQNAQLNSQLSDAKAELNRYHALAEYSFHEDSFRPAPDYSYLSLCRTYTDERGQGRLLRCADITADGEICSDYLENRPPKAHLYQNKKDTNRQNDFYGIWNWTVTQNKSDPTKDYFLTLYNPKYIPIEIIVLDDCNNISDLIERIKSGILLSTIPERMLLSLFNGAAYEGLLCDSASLESDRGVIFLKQSVVALAEFEFSENDIVRIDDKAFLRFLNTGMPKRIEKVKNAMETVKEILLGRITWSIFKQKEFIKNEYRQFKDFIRELPVEDILGEISSKCDCSIEDAHELLDELTKNAEDIMAGITPENEILAQVVRNDASLLKECWEELRQEWEDRNRELLDAANQQLTETRAENARLQEQIERKEKECAALNGRVNALQEQLQRKQQLANDVDEQVKAKIEQARENAASFIAECSFTRAISESPRESSTHTVSGSHFSEGVYRDKDGLEINNNWRDLLQTVQAELREAGVSDKHVISLSGVLYAAYHNNMPVLLAGPNGREIANAFSLALFGCTPANLYCDGDFNDRDLQQCQNSNAAIVVIENPFEHSWYTGVLRLLSLRRRFYIVVHPFTEDLTIEPNSLINYCFPMFTEAFVDSVPRMNYIGGQMTEPFIAFEQARIDDRKCYTKILKKMKLSLFAKNTIQQILADFHAMIPDARTENDYTFVLEPLALFLGASDELEDYKKEQAVGAPQ